VPENATPEHQEWFNDLRRVSASPENAARIMEACDKINVRALLPSVSVPTIVFHSDGDGAVPPDEVESWQRRFQARGLFPYRVPITFFSRMNQPGESSSKNLAYSWGGG